MVYAREAKEAGSNPRALGRKPRRGSHARTGRSERPKPPGRASSTSVLQPQVYHRVLSAILTQGVRFGRRRAERGGAGQRRICQRQPDRADARRPCARGGVRRRAGEPPDLRRPRGRRANIMSTTPAARSTSWRARPTCATARLWARTSARSPRASIRATISNRSARIWRASSARRSRTSPRRNGCRRRASAPSTR